MTFLETLVKNNIIEEDQVSQIIELADKKYKGSIDQALLEFNVDENKVLEIKGKFFNIPIRNVDPNSVLSSTLRLVPVDTVKTWNFIPIGVNNNVIEIGIIDPENVQAMDVLTFITAKIDKPFKLFLISISAYNELFKMYDGLTNEVDQALSELDSEIASAKNDDLFKKGKQNTDGENIIKNKIIVDAPIIKIVAVIIRHATEGRASDIHIENIGDRIKVRFRVDGRLYTSLSLPITVYSGIIARIKILSKLRLDEKRKPQDGGFSARIDGRKIDFRVSTMPSYYGEKVVIRILDPQRGVKTLDNLDLSPDNLVLIREAINRPYGLILITGPTGSGKTTTLYSLMKELDSESNNIISLEDPIEFQIPGVNQSQVAPEIGYTFASGLRSLLRQDPDIIMVGEIRDRETAELAIQAALTGHLVFSTLHTNNSIGAIPRLIDMGIDPYLIAPTLVLCVAQRLAKKICPTSKHAIPMEESVRIMINKQFEDLPEKFKSKIEIGNNIYEAVPSPECSSGIKDRVAIYEMFKVDKEMERVILSRPAEQEIYKLVRSRGMLTVREDAIIKALDGQIPFQEIYKF